MEKWKIFTVGHPSESELRTCLDLIWHSEWSWWPYCEFNPCRRKWASLAKTSNQHSRAAQIDLVELKAFRQARQYKPSDQRLLHHQKVRPQVATVKTKLKKPEQDISRVACSRERPDSTTRGDSIHNDSLRYKA